VSDRLERTMSMVLTLAAVACAVVLVKREFLDPNDPADRKVSTTPERVSNWNELRASGIALSSPTAPVTVVEFADLECPACKQFNSRLKETAEALHANIGLVLIHYPLSMHKFAKPAARGLECATSLGSAAGFVDVAYAKQDSFGLKSWVSYAQEAGVTDTLTFASCMKETAPIPRIEEGHRLGQVMKLEGTPLVIINGWRFPSVPDDTQLREAIKALLQGKNPPSGEQVDRFRSPVRSSG
jgi:protein-disulfide isomerase